MQRFLSIAFYTEKWRHPGFQKYFRNISWMFWTRMITMGVSFLATLYIARRLGPTNFGELDYAVAVVSMFSWIGVWGVETVLNRELVKYPEERNRIMGTGVILRFAFGAIATIITVVFALFSPIETVSQILILILSFTNIIAAPSILQTDFTARAESKYPSLITMCVSIIINFAKIIILLLGKGVIYLAIIMLFEQILYAVSYITIYKLKARGVFAQWEFSKTSAKVIIKSGTAIAFLALFSMIYARIDQIMIRNILDAQQVGLYSAGVRLVEVWNFLPAIIGGALYPAILNARKISEKLYHARLRKLFIFYLIPSICIAFFLSIFSHLLILLIFGSKFIGGYHALQVYAWSIIGTFIGYYIMIVLFNDDHRRILVLTTVLPAIVNVVLNIYWIPIFGITGAAYATLISYSLVPIIPLLFKRSREMFYEIAFHCT